MFEWLSRLSASASAGRANVSLDGRFLTVDSALSRVLGHSPDTLRRMYFQDITHADDLLRDEAHVEDLRQRGMGGYSMLKRYWRPGGDYLWAELNVTLKCDPHGAPAHFISHIRRTRIDGDVLSDLHARANHDPVTDVLNRRAFDEQLAAALHRTQRTGQRFALTLIDLDGFKRINDIQGHAAGDALLVQAAQRLRAACGPRDIIARIGGDEFAVLSQRCDEGQAPCDIPARLRTAFTKPFDLPDGPLHMTASMGCACFPTDGESGRHLLAQADARMYDDKRERFSRHRM
ncbi:diguanylate cyclase [Roseovarius sp. PS-C2]|uniref:GGDEF domain-containing protein n=1 Tax=Roseovarius sp. PS-C2 TaxID=2820814 RepID=UPI001C0BCDE8|nr:diguanylate cyclase [Roseovarius sp. PS-C2]